MTNKDEGRMARTVVGLDIGASGVRAAEFAVGRRTTMLRRFAAVELPEGAIRAGAVADPDALADALKELWSKGKFSTREVVFGVANDSVLVRQVDLDWMPPADFRKALRYQVADSLPVSVDEANLDYYMLDEFEAPDESGETRRMARVMLVAAGREMVDSFVRAMQAAGLRPLRVDLLPFALVRAVGPVTGIGAPLEAVVDLGAENVIVVVHQAGRPRFVRTFAGHGGQAVTRALMERYDWTWDEAERTKVALGLPGHTGPGAPVALSDDEPAPDLADHPAHQAIADTVESLVAELRATLHYFRGSGDEHQLSRIALTGRASRLGGLPEFLGERLGVAVERLDVSGRIDTSRKHVGGADDEAVDLAVATGLCLGAS
jgi:type IV pilus assembly protein PilM